MNKIFSFAALSLAAASHAQVGIDGAYGAEWAGVTSYHVTHTDSGPYGDFNNGVSYNTEGAGYDVYLRSDSNYLYGLLVATDHLGSAPQPAFANVYFNVDNYAITNEGSNFGMEMSANSSDAFVPGVAGSYSLGSYLTKRFLNDPANGTLSAEFALSWDFLTNDPDGMGFTKTKAGDRVTFRTSQSFGYAAAGWDGTDPNGAGTALNNYQDADRLGHTTFRPAVSAVPGPSALAMFGVGMLRRVRRRKK